MRRLPRHVALIMDGNGRWAQARGYPRVFGHVRGSSRIRPLVREANRLGIQAMTFYAFSTENWARPDSELQVLWKLLIKYVRKEIEESLEEEVAGIAALAGDPEARRKVFTEYIKIILEAPEAMESRSIIAPISKATELGATVVERILGRKHSSVLQFFRDLVEKDPKVSAILTDLEARSLGERMAKRVARSFLAKKTSSFDSGSPFEEGFQKLVLEYFDNIGRALVKNLNSTEVRSAKGWGYTFRSIPGGNSLVVFDKESNTQITFNLAGPPWKLRVFRTGSFKESFTVFAQKAENVADYVFKQI